MEESLESKGTTEKKKKEQNSFNTFFTNWGIGIYANPIQTFILQEKNTIQQDLIMSKYSLRSTEIEKEQNGTFEAEENHSR